MRRVDDARQRWTRTQDAMLRTRAGKVPVRQIAATLGRSVNAVRVRATRLKVSLSCPPGGMMACPRCGEWRTGLRGGRCRVCAKEDARRGLLEREEALEALVGPDYVEMSLARRGESHPRPRRPSPGAGSKAMAEWERELCEWLERENARIRRRCERMEAHLAAHGDGGDSVN